MQILGVSVPGPVSTLGRLGRGLAGVALSAVEGRHGVLWARINAPSSRVIVGVGKPAPGGPSWSTWSHGPRRSRRPRRRRPRTSCITRRTGPCTPGCCPRSWLTLSA